MSTLTYNPTAPPPNPDPRAEDAPEQSWPVAPVLGDETLRLVLDAHGPDAVLDNHGRLVERIDQRLAVLAQRHAENGATGPFIEVASKLLVRRAEYRRRQERVRELAGLPPVEAEGWTPGEMLASIGNRLEGFPEALERVVGDLVEKIDVELASFASELEQLSRALRETRPSAGIPWVDATVGRNHTELEHPRGTGLDEMIDRRRLLLGRREALADSVKAVRSERARLTHEAVDAFGGIQAIVGGVRVARKDGGTYWGGSRRYPELQRLRAEAASLNRRADDLTGDPSAKGLVGDLRTQAKAAAKLADGIEKEIGSEIDAAIGATVGLACTGDPAAWLELDGIVQGHKNAFPEGFPARLRSTRTFSVTPTCEVLLAYHQETN